MTRKIDEMDKYLLFMLHGNPEISQMELSKILKISQPAVHERIKKLKETGILAFKIGTDIKKAGLLLGRVHIATSDIQHVLGFLSNCPLFVNAYLSSGKYNLEALLVSEDMQSMMSCVDFHLRVDPCVRDMSFDVVVSPSENLILPIALNLDKQETSPCGKQCGNCSRYQSGGCLACPASTRYKGTIL